MATEPEVYTATVWRCPVCKQTFSFEEECRIHISNYHASPSQTALGLIGSYIAYESQCGNRVICRAERVTCGNRVHGPAVELYIDGTADLVHEYWIDVSQARYSTLDAESARTLWESWCEEASRDLEARFKGTWEDSKPKSRRVTLDDFGGDS